MPPQTQTSKTLLNQESRACPVENNNCTLRDKLEINPKLGNSQRQIKMLNWCCFFQTNIGIIISEAVERNML